jgi:hypothetical protein
MAAAVLVAAGVLTVTTVVGSGTPDPGAVARSAVEVEPGGAAPSVTVSPRTAVPRMSVPTSAAAPNVSAEPSAAAPKTSDPAVTLVEPIPTIESVAPVVQAIPAADPVGLVFPAADLDIAIAPI